MRAIYINEDNHHFYGCHPPEDMTPEGVDRLVDTYAEGTQVAGILFCVNLQRALFDSRVWESFWADYNPALGEDQPCLKRGHGVKNHLLLRERGIDQFARWLARCRHHGIEGWLTMRMNDCHGLEEYARRYPGADEHVMEWPSTFWCQHPELRRAPYRWERSFEGAFDYGKAEVRDHHLALIRELFERYDMFGLELDWMRWVMMFAPGHECAGRVILTDFIREVRRLADACAQRLGHPVKLAHRVPAHPEACLALGYDVATWVREGLADMLTLSSMLGAANFDYPLEIWRAMVGDKVTLLAHAEAVAQPYPEQSVISYELLYGAAATALHRGADGIYLFNECYREGDDPELLHHMLTHVGNIETLQQFNRRHAVTFPQVYAAGQSKRTVLPIPLRVPKIGCDFGRLEENITLRINIGPSLHAGRAVLRLGFSPNIPVSAFETMIVRVNTQPVVRCDAPQWNSISADLARRNKWNTDLPTSVGAALWYDLPLTALHADVNVIEFVPPQIDGTLEWAEVLVLA
ncbi:MAG: hypothetical protein KKD76_03150 [Verrucomicrobia bacterium]|nr:hypothetical protein [Verrucomicrobiota bacterium]